MLQLRPYQQQDKKAIEAAWIDNRSVLYQLPTGGGKSVVLSSIINDYKNEQILIFAHKRKLLIQLKDHLSSIGITAGVLAGSLQENLDSNIIIVSIRTAVKDTRLEMLLERDWNKVIIDEARHSRTASYDKVLDALVEKHPTHRLLGVDATPYRKDKKRLDKHFQFMVTSQQDIASLTKLGFLQKCKTIISPIELEVLQEEVKEVANDYQITALSNYMRKPKFLNYVVSQYIEYGEGRQTIVFAVDKAHAKDLQVVFQDNGYEGKVSRVDSDMSEEQIATAYKRFESGDAQILINVEMITEGVDLPSAGCIIGARPTKSLTLFMQIVGRGMRPDGVNDYFILLDCCGWTGEYGTIGTPKHWSLNPEIDPNGLRQGNKIFGRTKEGKLTEDLDLFFGEVVEMSPDEYLANLQDGKERAEQINVDIQTKIDNVFEAMLNLIIDTKKSAEKFNYTKEQLHKAIAVSFKYNKTADKGRWGNRVELRIDQDRKRIYAEVSSSFSRETAVEFYEIAEFNGIINRTIRKGGVKLHQQVFELFEQIADLEKSKINLDKFQKAEQKMKEDQWKQGVEDWAKEGKKFNLKKPVAYTDYFKETNYEWKGSILAIDIPSKKINGHHNTITLHLRKHTSWKKNEETGKDERVYAFSTDEKKYVKGDKVYELIKKEWDNGIEVETEK